MAVGVRFELTERLSTPADFQDRCNKPLCQPTIVWMQEWESNPQSRGYEPRMIYISISLPCNYSLIPSRHVNVFDSHTILVSDLIGKCLSN